MYLKRSAVSLILVCCALLSMFYWWKASQPVILVDALTDHLSCVSYAPFRKPGQTPFDKSLLIDADEIETDLKLLSQRFDCVRIYSVNQGLQEVPRLAQKHGMKVLLGIWIGRNAVENERELTRGIDLAKKYSSSIRAVIVGNEVLLRGEQPASAMRAYLQRVKDAVKDVPVTYADVWEFWLSHPELAEAVDFVTIHILPYWEDRPIDIDNAVGHVSHIYQHVKGLVKGKDVMIGETGWPSYGRQRQGAAPSLINQARFIREFAVRAELEKIPYNVIEAFDQPWKRKLEGAVGGYWGLYDRLDQAKFPFRGPVAEAPDWSLAAIGAMSLIFFAFLRNWKSLPGREIALLLALSIACGGACMAAWRDMAMASRGLVEGTLMGIFSALLLVATFMLGAPLAAWCVRGQDAPTVAPLSQLLLWIRRNEQRYDAPARGLGALRILFLFGAAFVSLLLVFDPRYRDFPLALYAVPAIGFALLSTINPRQQADLEEIMLAAWVGLSAPLIALSEHLITPRDAPWRMADSLNPHALGWSGLSLLLSGAVLVPVILQLRTRQS